MKAFLDTSSLIKLYHKEEGSDSVMNAFSNDIREFFLSELAILEFRSALWKKIREKEIKEKTAIELLEKLRYTLLPKLMSGELRVKLRQQEAGI
jgi:predicted nucleic acid-binding protein